MSLNNELPKDNLFSERKQDHIAISQTLESQAVVDQFSRLAFLHNPLPEIDFSEVSLKTKVFGYTVQSPHFVSSMTLGHEGAQSLNKTIFAASARKGWMAGVGSQRKQLFDRSAVNECNELREQFPDAVLFGNIGLTQLIQVPTASVEALVDSLKAQFLVVHTNPLQEAIQPEGTPQFRGGIEALRRLCGELSVPVVLKETGCGFSPQSLMKLQGVGLAAIDVAGMGGTHWGRVEGLRQDQSSIGYRVAQTFGHWGIPTVDAVLWGKEVGLNLPIWASGGVRTGLESAKLMALGAAKVGFAQPILQAALKGLESLEDKMEQLDQELKTALFCLGLKSCDELLGQRELLRWK